jgi:hypothetical protein
MEPTSPRLESFDQSVIINDWTSRYINQDHPVLHPFKGGIINHTLSLGCKGTSENDSVRFGVQLVQRYMTFGTIGIGMGMSGMVDDLFEAEGMSHR